MNVSFEELVALEVNGLVEWEVGDDDVPRLQLSAAGRRAVQEHKRMADRSSHEARVEAFHDMQEALRRYLDAGGTYRVDRHNACPACSVLVQALYEAAETVVSVQALNGAVTPAAWDDLVAAVTRFRPIVGLHFDNHDHAYSAELAGARMAMVNESPAIVELERRLPISGDEP